MATETREHECPACGLAMESEGEEPDEENEDFHPGIALALMGLGVVLLAEAGYVGGWFVPFVGVILGTTGTLVVLMQTYHDARNYIEGFSG